MSDESKQGQLKEDIWREMPLITIATIDYHRFGGPEKEAKLKAQLERINAVIDEAKADLPQDELFMLKVASEGKMSLTFTCEQSEKLSGWVKKWFGEDAP